MTASPPIERFPTTFRRRLSLAFVLVAGLAAGSLALGASAAVTSYRLHSFRERARADAVADMGLLESAPSASALVERLRRSEQPGGSDLLVLEDGRTSSSVETLRIDDVPMELQRATRSAPGELAQATTELGGDSFFVLGQQLDSGAELYFFFSRGDVLRRLHELRITLLVGWVVVLAAAAVVGTVVARRTLRPVQAAADAARSVTEGLLETRLVAPRNDEFGQWAQSFNEMVGALEEKVAALERARDRELRFNADIAHELRTPLGALVTAATLVEEQQADLPVHLRRPSQLVVAGARRLHRLVDDLLELHRLEAGEEVVEGDRLDLVDAVRDALWAHGWADVVKLEDRDRPLVVSDRRRIDRIVVNLVGNALDHGGGAVTVTVRHDGRWACLEVTDEGPGIPPDDLPHLFDRYYKVSRSRTAPHAPQRSTGGSGLGLAIVSEQTRLLGGTISVASQPGAGATFLVRLPLEEPEVGSPVTPGPGRPLPPPA